MQDLLSAPLKIMPRRLRRQYQGDTAVDGTPLQAFSRGGGRGGKWLPWDHTTGYYVHKKDTNDRDAPQQEGTARGKPKAKAKPATVKKGIQAHEAALVIACDSTPGERQTFPALAIGFALGVPGVDPAGQAIRVFRRLGASGMARQYVGVDRLYPFQKVENWAQPLRELGWAAVFDYRVDQLGVVGTVKGSIVVEGALYCPSMPPALISATIDLRAGEITEDEYKQRIARREVYRLRQKESEDHNGTVRYTCPAGGNAPPPCDARPSHPRCPLG